MAELKYKVGDRVRIKNFDWFRNEGANMVVVYMTKYYGEVVTIKSINNGFYRIKEDGGQYCWIDEMFECKVDEKIKPKFKVGDKVKDKNNRVWFIVRVSETFFDISSIPNGTDGSEVSGYFVPMEDQDDYELISNDMENMRFKVGDKITNGKTTLTILTLTPDRYLVKDNFGECGILYFNSQDGWKIVEEETKPKYEDEVNGEYYSIPKYLVRPNGYQFVDENGIVITAKKIVLVKKKKEYPKTFEECVHVLEGENRMSLELMNTFRKLIDARNAYWKIYGEENGLGKPWEPTTEVVFCISRINNRIELLYKSGKSDILEFPTPEMRDAFYENFKKEIESCKEFL